LEDQLFYTNAARLLLLLVFLAITYLVYYAYQRRIKEGRN
jgi:neurotransmitter:Na+ symporter, NSS family